MEQLKIVKPDDIKNSFKKNFATCFVLLYIMRELIYTVIYIKAGKESLTNVNSLYGWALLWSAIDGLVLVLSWKISAILSFKDKCVRVQELDILKSFFTMFSIIICVVIAILFLNNLNKTNTDYENKIDSYRSVYNLFVQDSNMNFDNYKESLLKEFKKITRTTILIRIFLGISCNILGLNCIRNNIKKLGILEEIYNEIVEREKQKEEKVESSYSSDEMGT